MIDAVIEERDAKTPIKSKKEQSKPESIAQRLTLLLLLLPLLRLPLAAIAMMASNQPLNKSIRLLILRSSTALAPKHEIIQKQTRPADGFSDIQLEIVKGFG